MSNSNLKTPNIVSRPECKPELNGPIGPYWAYLVPIGPHLIPIGALSVLIGPYLALTIKQKHDTEGPHRGHRSETFTETAHRSKAFDISSMLNFPTSSRRGNIVDVATTTC